MPNPPTNKARRWLRRIAWGAVAVLVGVLLTILALRGHFGGRLEAERQKLAELGLPTTLEGVEALYPQAPDDENGARLFLAAADAMIENDKTYAAQEWASEHGVFSKYGQVAPEGLALFRADLEQNVKALELARKAAQYEQTRYPIKLTTQLFSSVDHYSKLRNIARLVSRDMVAAAHAGDAARWLQDARVMCALTRSLHVEPLTRSQIARVALDQLLLYEIERPLRLGLFDTGHLAELQRMLQKQDDREDWRRGYDFEATIVAAQLHEEAPPPRWDWSQFLYQIMIDEPIRNYCRELGIGHVVPALYAVTKITEAAVAHHVAVQRRVYELASMPYPQMQRKRPSLDRMNEGIGITGALARAMGGGLSWVEPAAKNQAHRRLWITRLALERYRLAHGELPYELQALVPEYLESVPLDPKDGRPLKYLRPENVGLLESDMDVEIELYAE